jgi:DNA polymerase-3 subunit chi
MTDVSFYHLQREPLEHALPKLLEKALEQGMRALVLTADEDRVETLNTALWTYRQDSFLPHGSAADGPADEQPVYLTTIDENTNGANLLVLVHGAGSAKVGDYDRCLDLFDGRDDDAVAAARDRWKKAKEAGYGVTYWQQSAQGRWEKKA